MDMAVLDLLLLCLFLAGKTWAQSRIAGHRPLLTGFRWRGGFCVTTILSWTGRWLVSRPFDNTGTEWWRWCDMTRCLLFLLLTFLALLSFSSCWLILLSFIPFDSGHTLDLGSWHHWTFVPPLSKNQWVLDEGHWGVSCLFRSCTA